MPPERASDIASSPTITVCLVKPPIAGERASPEPATKKRKLNEAKVIASYNLHVSALTKYSEYFKGLMSFEGIEVTENRIYFELPELDCPFRSSGDLMLDGSVYSIIALKCWVDWIYSGSYKAEDYALSLLSGSDLSRSNPELFDKVFLVNAAVYVLAERLLSEDLKQYVVETTYNTFNTMALVAGGAEDMSKRELWEVEPSWLTCSGMDVSRIGAPGAVLWLNGFKWILDGTVDEAVAVSTANRLAMSTGVPEEKAKEENEKEDEEKDVDFQESQVDDDFQDGQVEDDDDWEERDRRIEEEIRRERDMRIRLLGKEPMRRLITAFVACLWETGSTAWPEYTVESKLVKDRRELWEQCPELQTMVEGYYTLKVFDGGPSLLGFYREFSLERVYERHI
ncbi:hypothetical protein BJ508DRAFT_304585 [Ascobolus immersus RN42]|uniref:BTB domain-containing protein n=1 Tax=Ascobolus immersus RN42 TaxID=1160509 RepID=A0A3N4IHP9_ASCIM|nr:hypothetical protein BJ508DRAFT_304585 [Ascobolus immersus RN42]